MIAPDQFVQLIISAMAIIGILLLAIVAYISGHLRYKLQAQRQSNALLNALVEERERTLNEISVEVHDHLGQLTSFSVMTLKQALDCPSRPESDDLVNNAIRLIEEVNLSLRAISHSLNATYIKQQGLIAMMERELEYLCKIGKVQYDFLLFGTPVHLGEEVELVLYRITQEAILNAIKHGNPTSIVVELAFFTNRMTMAINDNGKGFKPFNETFAAGIGIANMKHRATLIGASLQISSTAGTGTQVVLTLPVKKI